MNESMPGRWIPQNKPQPLWHRGSDKACPCCLLSVTWFRSILGERTHSCRNSCTNFYYDWQHDWADLWGIHDYWAFQDEGLAPCTTWLISACNLNPRLETFCAAFNDATLKKAQHTFYFPTDVLQLLKVVILAFITLFLLCTPSIAISSKIAIEVY